MTELATSWVKGPLLALDLETTGLDPYESRIVTAAIVIITPQVGPHPKVDVRNWLADPGMEIPPETTKVHGITTEQARRDGRPAAEVVGEIEATLADVWTATTPLCVFKAQYDLTLLDAELRRHLGRGVVLGGPVIDPLMIHRHLNPNWPRRRSRELGHLCEHFKVRHEEAHTSEGDALATLRLAWTLARKNPNDIGLVAPETLHDRQVSWYSDRKLAYADTLDREAQEKSAQNGDKVEIDRLRARVAATRANAPCWPVLPSPVPKRLPPRVPPKPGEPPNARASWTPELKAALREEWLAADPAEPAETLREDIATRSGRTSIAIRARLLQLRCDPEKPGRRCDEERAAYLKQVYDAEFRKN